MFDKWTSDNGNLGVFDLSSSFEHGHTERWGLRALWKEAGQLSLRQRDTWRETTSSRFYLRVKIIAFSLDTLFVHSLSWYCLLRSGFQYFFFIVPFNAPWFFTVCNCQLFFSSWWDPSALHFSYILFYYTIIFSGALWTNSLGDLFRNALFKIDLNIYFLNKWKLTLLPGVPLMPCSPSLPGSP